MPVKVYTVSRLRFVQLVQQTQRTSDIMCLVICVRKRQKDTQFHEC